MIARICLTVLALAAVCLPEVPAGATPPADWLMFRLNPANNAVLPGTLRVRWTLETGAAISASPTVAGSTLYIGNNRGELFALAVRSGRILWTRHMRNAVMTAPLLYDGLAIVGDGNAVSSGSGPGSLYVGIGPSGLTALDAATGRAVWHHPMAGSAMPTGAIVDGILLEHDGAGWLGAFDPVNGKHLYARNLHSIESMGSVLPVGGGRVVTDGVQVNAAIELRASDGATIWRTIFPASGSGHGDCPQVTDGARIYCDYVMPAQGRTYTSDGKPATEHAYALDVRTGAKRWDIALETGNVPPRNEAAIPVLSGGVLFFGSAIAPYMHAVDARSGRKIWTRRVRGVVKGGPVVLDGRIYFGDLAGYLWALDSKTGAVVGDKRMPSGFNVGSPIVVGETLVIGSRTGAIYALPLDEIAASHDA